MAKWTVWCQPKMGIFLVLLCSIRHSRGHPDIYHVRPKDGSRVIQPYSCHDPETKEEGVCMFSWNCQRSNGTHLTYCMDRFYFGSCCRLPPGVYIATPPPVISNEVTLAQKQKLKPSTTPTIRLTTTEPSTSKRWPTEEKRVPSSTSSSTVFTKQTQTEFPPGLVTWRPKGESSSTPAPVKRKPTKIFSTKPLLASSTAEPGTTEGSKLFSLDSTISTRPTTPSTSATTVTRRRTRPTRPYGSNNPKRKTRPTRPYPVRNATASGVTRRKTKPTRPSYRPTTPSSSISTDVERPTTRATIGTWSNILDQSTRPLPFTRKTTPSSATRNTPRPTRITAATRPPSVRPTQTTRQPTSRPTQTTATHPSSARPTQTTATRPSSARPTQTLATRPSAARPTQALATRLSTSRPTQATATRLSTSRPTQTAATRPPTAKPVRLTTTTRPTTKPTRTIVTRPSTTRPTRPPTARPTHISVETTSRRSTVDTTPPRRRTKPTRPQYSSTTVPTRPSTVRAPLPSRKPEVTTRTTEPPVKSTFEIITFPPFPGVFGLPTKAPSTISPISDVRTTTTFKPKTTVKKPTSSITYPSTTEWSTQAPTTEHSTTTEKITPGQDHSKDFTVAQPSTWDEFSLAAGTSDELASSTLNPNIELTTEKSDDTTENWFTMTTNPKHNSFLGLSLLPQRPSQVLYDENGNEIVNQEHFEDVALKEGLKRTPTPAMTRSTTVAGTTVEDATTATEMPITVTERRGTTTQLPRYTTEGLMSLGKGTSNGFPSVHAKNSVTSPVTPTFGYPESTTQGKTSAFLDDITSQNLYSSTIDLSSLGTTNNDVSTANTFADAHDENTTTTADFHGFVTVASHKTKPLASTVGVSSTVFDNESKTPVVTTSHSTDGISNDTTIQGNHLLDYFYENYDYYEDTYEDLNLSPVYSTTERNKDPYQVNNHKITERPTVTFVTSIQENTIPNEAVSLHTEMVHTSTLSSSQTNYVSNSHKNKVTIFQPTIPQEGKVPSTTDPSLTQKRPQKPFLPNIPHEPAIEPEEKNSAIKPTQAIKNSHKPPFSATSKTPLPVFTTMLSTNDTTVPIPNTDHPVADQGGIKSTIVTIDNHRPPVASPLTDFSPIISTYKPHKTNHPQTSTKYTTLITESSPQTDPYSEPSLSPEYLSSYTTEGRSSYDTPTDLTTSEMSRETNSITTNRPTIRYPFPTILMQHTTKTALNTETESVFPSTSNNYNTEMSTGGSISSIGEDRRTTSDIGTEFYGDTSQVVTSKNTISTIDDRQTTYNQVSTAGTTAIFLESTNLETNEIGSSIADTDTQSTDAHSPSDALTNNPDGGTSTTLKLTVPSTTVTKEMSPPTTIVTTVPTTTEFDLSSADFKEVCGKPNPGPVGRIVGGGNSFFGEWPWVVSLRQWKKNAFLHKCGATLLNEFWAITAAHCVENVPLTDILLRLGEYDISHENEPLPFVERRVQIVASHPQFDRRTFEYDLALLRFYEPITFQRNILPICIPAGNDTYVGKYATVTGWGRLYEDGPLPDVIQEVSLPIITNKLCENMYRQAGFVEDIPDIFICAGYGDGGKDSCEGDSGGPMVLQEDDGRWVLAGVISWGIGCALPNQPGVYTRITKFSEWINQIIIF